MTKELMEACNDIMLGERHDSTRAGVIVNKQQSNAVDKITYNLVGIDSKQFENGIDNARDAYRQSLRYKKQDIHIEIERLEHHEGGGTTRYRIRKGKWVGRQNPAFDNVPPCSSIESFRQLEI